MRLHRACESRRYETTSHRGGHRHAAEAARLDLLGVERSHIVVVELIPLVLRRESIAKNEPTTPGENVVAYTLSEKKTHSTFFEIAPTPLTSANP